MAKRESRELTTIDDLPEHRAKTVEAGLATFQHMSHQVDELRKEISNYQDEISKMEVQVESLKRVVKIYEEQAKSYQAERDQAVADRAVYETLFASIQAMLIAFRVPVAPLAREQSSQSDDEYARELTSRLSNGLREGLDHIDREAGHAPYDGGHEEREPYYDGDSRQ
jgi:hypothetical protein